MDLRACRYGTITKLSGEREVEAIRISNSESTFHFFRPVLVIYEERVAWGYPVSYKYDCYDVAAGVSSLPRRFRTGSSFSLSLRFVLFVKLLRDGGQDRWIHLPASAGFGATLDPSTRGNDTVKRLLSEHCRLSDAVDSLVSLLPHVLRRQGDTIRCLNGASPCMSAADADFPSQVSVLAARSAEGQHFPYVTDATYWGSALCRLVQSPTGPSTPTLSIPRWAAGG